MYRVKLEINFTQVIMANESDKLLPLMHIQCRVYFVASHILRWFDLPHKITPHSARSLAQ